MFNFIFLKKLWFNCYLKIFIYLFWLLFFFFNNSIVILKSLF